MEEANPRAGLGPGGGTRGGAVLPATGFRGQTRLIVEQQNPWIILGGAWARVFNHLRSAWAVGGDLQ